MSSSEVDCTEDLKRIDRPPLIIRGDDDQIVPFKASGERTVKIVRNVHLRVYPGGCHGRAQVQPQEINADVPGVINS